MVALGALHDKASATIASWFFEHIICENGKPWYVCSDRGGEFCGALDSLLQSLAIAHVTTVPSYPQSNGTDVDTVVAHMCELLAIRGIENLVVLAH